MAVPRNVAGFTTLQTWTLIIRHQLFLAVANGVTFPAAVDAAEILAASWRRFPVTFALPTAAATALAPFTSLTSSFLTLRAFAIGFPAVKGCNLTIRKGSELLVREVA